MTDINAAHNWNSNAELILDIHKLGYIKDSDQVLDCTYGLGTFWKKYRPPNLTCTDIDPDKSPFGASVDFTELYKHFERDNFDVVVLDAPFKLQGSPDKATQDRYGLDKYIPWQERHRIIRSGIFNSLRVLKKGGVLLLKCQDQVCSGKVRWQTLEFTNWAMNWFELEDRFDMLGGRKQPEGTNQLHARRNYSTMLVFRKK